MESNEGDAGHFNSADPEDGQVRSIAKFDGPILQI
jgi:hypothetical protein